MCMYIIMYVQSNLGTTWVSYPQYGIMWPVCNCNPDAIPQSCDISNTNTLPHSYNATTIVHIRRVALSHSICQSVQLFTDITGCNSYTSQMEPSDTPCAIWSSILQSECLFPFFFPVSHSLTWLLDHMEYTRVDLDRNRGIGMKSMCYLNSSLCGNPTSVPIWGIEGILHVALSLSIRPSHLSLSYTPHCNPYGLFPLNVLFFFPLDRTSPSLSSSPILLSPTANPNTDVIMFVTSMYRILPSLLTCWLLDIGVSLSEKILVRCLFILQTTSSVSWCSNPRPDARNPCWD